MFKIEFPKKLIRNKPEAVSVEENFRILIEFRGVLFLELLGTFTSDEILSGCHPIRFGFKISKSKHHKPFSKHHVLKPQFHHHYRPLNHGFNGSK